MVKGWPKAGIYGELLRYCDEGTLQAFNYATLIGTFNSMNYRKDYGPFVIQI